MTCKKAILLTAFLILLFSNQGICQEKIKEQFDLTGQVHTFSEKCYILIPEGDSLRIGDPARSPFYIYESIFMLPNGSFIENEDIDVTLDRKGRPVKELEYKQDGELKSKKIFQYEAGKSEMFVFRKNNFFRTKIDMCFNKDSILTRVEQRDKYNNLRRYIELFYEEGRLSKIKVIRDSTVIETTSYTYKPSERITAVAGTRDINGDGAIYYGILNDESGRISKISKLDKELNILGTMTYQYNEKGLVSHCELINTDSDPQKWIYKYAYDNHGNWIRQLHLLNEKPSYVTKREITYYQD